MESGPLSQEQPWTAALTDADHLGEGPHWDARSRQLTRVDITNGLVHAWDPEHGTQSVLELGPPVSFAIPRDLGGLVFARQHRICLLADGQDEMTLAALDEQAPDVRFNDGKCDRLGRLWAGTMSTTRTPGAGALYRLGADGLKEVVGATTISNGIGWSPDCEQMYFIDSTTQQIDVFDFDLAGAEISNRRPLARIANADGLPDGLAVDKEGGVWIALFGGGAVRRYEPSGRLSAEVKLPVSNPTCPVFGGPKLDTIYVTSARHRLSPTQLQAEPLAGAVFALQPGVEGICATRFSA